MAIALAKPDSGQAATPAADAAAPGLKNHDWPRTACCPRRRRQSGQIWGPCLKKPAISEHMLNMFEAARNGDQGQTSVLATECRAPGRTRRRGGSAVSRPASLQTLPSRNRQPAVDQFANPDSIDPLALRSLQVTGLARAATLGDLNGLTNLITRRRPQAIYMPIPPTAQQLAAPRSPAVQSTSDNTSLTLRLDPPRTWARISVKMEFRGR